MSDKPVGMTPYEAKRWDAIEEWRASTPRGLLERLPEGVRERGRQVADKAMEVWDKVPGNEGLQKAFATAIRGGFDMTLDATEKTISEKKVVARVTENLPIEAKTYQDLRALDLFVLDERSPKNAKKRAAIAAGHGAAAGFIAGGATAAGAASGGMGALPAAGVVALSVIADTAAVSVGSMQGAAYVGAHYGYDPREPAERAMMMSLLAGVLAEDAARAQALRQVRQLALDLAARRAVADLNESVLYRMMLRLYGSLMLDTAKRSIAKGVPILGAGIAAGSNYHSVRRTIVAADHAYPRRWLVEKYSSGADEPIDVETVEKSVRDATSGEDSSILDRLEDIDTADVDEGGDTKTA
ncbi:MAG TPA: EcsC family protein [Iamia sp.]|nr:EcsC family protein [Iamia sp.]